MAGAATGGAELFFERLAVAMAGEGPVLPIIRRNAGRAARLEAGGLTPVQLRFGGALDVWSRVRLARRLRAFGPAVVMAWMGRAASMTPRGDWVLVGRLGGTYDLGRFRRCDHLVANTRGLVRWIERQGWPAGRVHHLPNFVPDLGGAAPAVLPVPAGVPVVLAMGRLHANKAFDVLIRALPRLPGVHCVIAGEGPERGALLALAAAEGVAGRLHLLGWREDQAALLAATAVLVCPSRVEPLGNVVLEAFSAGVPVVAAAAAGPAEVIRDGVTGLLVPLEDEGALAEAIGRVIGDTAYGARLAGAGRREFDTAHAAPVVLARWRGVLGGLAGQERREDGGAR